MYRFDNGDEIINNTLGKSISIDNGFAFFSQVHVPFEPKTQEQKAIRELIRNEINKMGCDKKYLFARYGTTNPACRFFDIENVLFYNIGMSTFRKFMNNGARFAKVFPDEVARIRQEHHVPEPFCHYYEYRFVDALPKESNDPLYQWENKPFCGLKNNAADYWRYFRSTDLFPVDLKGDNLAHKPFAIHLIIEKPTDEKGNITNYLKPMLDGMICAYHSFAGNPDQLSFIAEKLGVDEATVQNGNHNVFGEMNYVQYYERAKNKLKWNPADDRLVECSVKMVQGNEWKISGSISSSGDFCPVCGNSDLAVHCFGMPAFNDDFRQKVDAGLLIIDGCCKPPCAPRYRCRKCKEDF